MKRVPARLLIPVTLVVLAGGAWIYMQMQAAAQERQQVGDLLADVDRELAKERPDGSELSLLVARIRQAGDPERDDRLRRALARIEVARGRKEKAWEYLEPLAMAMGREPDPADQLLGARLLVELHAVSGRSDDLRRALELAESVHRANQDPSALFVAFQCAVRLGEEAVEMRERLADQLIEEAPRSPAAELVTLLRRDQEQVTPEECRGLAARFEEVPVELGMALVAAYLRAGAIADALRELDQVMPRAPALVDLRHLGAAACWAFTTTAEGAAQAEVQRRSSQMREHLRWLLERASAKDPRRPTWRAMLDGR